MESSKAARGDDYPMRGSAAALLDVENLGAASSSLNFKEKL